MAKSKSYADIAQKIINKYSKRGDGDMWSNTAKEMQLKQLMNSQEMERSKMGLVDNEQQESQMGMGMDDESMEMKNGGHWIPKHLKKGRCTPAPNPDCPKGSPQYNLAMTFKKHHGFHEMGGDMKYGNGGTYNPITGQWEGGEETSPYIGPYSLDTYNNLNLPAGYSNAKGVLDTKDYDMRNKGLYDQFQAENTPEYFANRDQQLQESYNKQASDFRDTNPISYGTQAQGVMGEEQRPSNKSKFDYKSYLMDAAGLAPVAYNLYQGLKKEDRLNPKDYQVNQRIQPYKLNYDPAKNAALSSNRALDKEIMNTGNKSTADIIANLRGSRTGYNQQVSDIVSKEQMGNAAINMQAQQANIGIEQSNKSTKFAVDDWNAKSKAARINMLGEAATQLSQFAQGKKSDKVTMNAINSMLNNYVFDMNGNLRFKDSNRLVPQDEANHVKQLMVNK